MIDNYLLECTIRIFWFDLHSSWGMIMFRILRFFPIPSFLRIAFILPQQLSRLWLSGLQLLLRSSELCGIPSTWDWTITKLTQGNRAPKKDDRQIGNIYFIIIYFYYMRDSPILFYRTNIHWNLLSAYLGKTRSILASQDTVTTRSGLTHTERTSIIFIELACKHIQTNICWSPEKQTTRVSSKFKGALI